MAEVINHTANAINGVRRDIKDVAQRVKFMADIAKRGEHQKGEREDTGELIANLVLTYRHLEDASMRLGKALQAHDGGVSVYDKATTVGAERHTPAEIVAINQAAAHLDGILAIEDRKGLAKALFAIAGNPVEG